MMFKTPEGEAAFMASYDAALAQVHVPYTVLRVPTQFGSTHVIASGPDNGPPLVLLHAQGTSSTVWVRNVAALSQTYRTYLVDRPGDANKSLSSAPIGSRADGAQWLSEVFDGLGIDRAHLGGLSYGGWLALAFALAAPARINSLVLLAPAASFARLSLSFFTNFLGAMLFPTRARVQNVFRWLSGNEQVVDERLAEQMFLGVRHFQFPKGGTYPSVFTDAELQQMRLPTLLLVGDREVIYDPRRVVSRAKRLIPGIQAELVPNAGHVLNMDQPDLVNQRVLEFLGSTEQAATTGPEVAACSL